MGDTVLSVPSIQMEFTEAFGKETIPTARYIRQNYNQYITPAASSVNLDSNIVVAFIIVESGRQDGSGTVNPTAKSPVGALGLMQLMPETAFDTITVQAPVMTNQQKALINKYLPGFIKIGGFTGFYASWKDKISAALLIAEFNIWVGTWQLAQLIKGVIKDTGKLNLAQVIVKYNAGVGNYNKYVVKNKLQTADSTALVKGLQNAGGLKESRQYIVKLLGINGAMVAALKTAA